MSEQATFWRCRRCGKWSTAKRDPIAHKPERPDPEHPDSPFPYGWRAEWCGPFDRWTARYDDPNPRSELPNAGQPVLGNGYPAADEAPGYERLTPEGDVIPF